MTRAQKSVLLVAIITSFMGPFLISSVNIALPIIEKQLQLNAVSLSWVITSFLLSSGIFLLPAGKWADFLGHKKIFKAGTVLFLVFTLLCSFSTNGNILIIVRFIQGIGASLLMATSPAILVREFPKEKRGAVLGITVAAVYVGLAVGPTAGGFITFYWGWQAIFLLSSLIGLVVMIVAFKYLGSDKLQSDKKSLDYKGAIIYAIGLSALVYGSSVIKEYSGQIIVLSGIVLMFLFIWQQSKSSDAFFPVKEFKINRLFTYSNLAALINYSATFAIVFLMSLFLQKALDLNPRTAGSILIAQPIVMAVLSPIAGKLSDKYEPRYLASAGMFICSLGLGLFATLNENSSLYFIIINLAFIGLGFALFSSPNMNTIMSSVSKEKAGMASGISATMRVLGQILSMTIATALFAVYFDKKSIDTIDINTFVKGMKILFLIFSLLCFSGIYFSLNRGKLY
ncbi:MFS transporter [Carboxylicivirga caseinilyticus]|uniref:MFS transporter n=1 Tax=Carboxylicivirga caseinilyticus TaxID=3417572 RepID=UPI003D32FFB0|nr:MFS transporter [Marinilabiliaceae bacterium A049]